MKRRQYSHILCEGDSALLEQCVSEIERNTDIRILKGPETALVMQQARDAVSGQPFNLGELLVTACTVRLDGATGYGACLGEAPDKAYALAVADAAFTAKRPEAQRWVPLLLEEEQAILMRRRNEQRQVMNTRVRFETADEYGDRGR